MCSECDWEDHNELEDYRLKDICDCGNREWVLACVDMGDDEERTLIYRCTKCDALKDVKREMAKQ